MGKDDSGAGAGRPPAERVIRHAGTWLPALLVSLFFSTLVRDIVAELTWERPAAYAVGGVSLVFGLWALAQMARFHWDEHPSFFLLVLIYQKVFLAMVFFAVFGFAANDVLAWFPEIPEVLLYPTLTASVGATSVVNLTLFFGRPRGWLELPSDPVPLRQLLRDRRLRRARTP